MLFQPDRTFYLRSDIASYLFVIAILVIKVQTHGGHAMLNHKLYFLGNTRVCHSRGLTAGSYKPKNEWYAESNKTIPHKNLYNYI